MCAILARQVFLGFSNFFQEKVTGSYLLLALILLVSVLPFRSRSSASILPYALHTPLSISFLHPFHHIYEFSLWYSFFSCLAAPC